MCLRVNWSSVFTISSSQIRGRIVVGREGCGEARGIFVIHRGREQQDY